jgi:hypothetical protein
MTTPMIQVYSTLIGNQYGVNFYHTYIVATYSTGTVEVLNAGPQNPDAILTNDGISDLLGNNQQQIYGNLLIDDSLTLPTNKYPDTNAAVTVFTPNAGSDLANDNAISSKMQGMVATAESLGTVQRNTGGEEVTTNIAYNIFGNNSNAVTNTLLRSVGITPSTPKDSNNNSYYAPGFNEVLPDSDSGVQNIVGYTFQWALDNTVNYTATTVNSFINTLKAIANSLQSLMNPLIS